VSESREERIFRTPFASIHRLYVAKVERKGRTRDELDEVIRWLTGFDAAELETHIEAGTTFTDFFAAARLHPHSDKITGLVCGVRVENVAHPLMRKIRLLDKVVDELANGRAVAKVMRG
jgi:hypothetical protein